MICSEGKSNREFFLFFFSFHFEINEGSPDLIGRHLHRNDGHQCVCVRITFVLLHIST